MDPAQRARLAELLFAQYRVQSDYSSPRPAIWTSLRRQNPSPWTALTLGFRTNLPPPFQVGEGN